MLARVRFHLQNIRDRRRADRVLLATIPHRWLSHALQGRTPAAGAGPLALRRRIDVTTTRSAFPLLEPPGSAFMILLVPTDEDFWASGASLSSWGVLRARSPFLGRTVTTLTVMVPICYNGQMTPMRWSVSTHGTGGIYTPVTRRGRAVLNGTRAPRPETSSRSSRFSGAQRPCREVYPTRRRKSKMLMAARSRSGRRLRR